MKNKIRALIVAVCFGAGSPAFAIFDISAYVGPGVGPMTIEPASGGNVTGMDYLNIGGWVNPFYFELPVPVVNAFIGVGLYGDYTTFEKTNAAKDGVLGAGGAQGIIGAGIGSLSLYLRPGFGYAIGAYEYRDDTTGNFVPTDISGFTLNFAVGLNFEVISILNFIVEYGLPSYSLTAAGKGDADESITGGHLRFGVRLAF